MFLGELFLGRNLMDWRTIDFDWNRARAFLVTAEEGSLSAASRALGMTQTTLGRQVAALEKELGVDLFDRVGRGLVLTPTGLELVENVKSMADAASKFSLAATGKSQMIEGDIRITCSEVMGVYFMPAIIKKLRDEEPGINIELLATNDRMDLKKREADIAISSYRPTQPDLIMRKIADFKHYLYAAPSYIASLGPVHSLNCLKRAQFLGFDLSHIILKGLNERGFDLAPENFPVLCANHVVQWEMVRAGGGIGVMMDEVGDADPLVERVLPELPVFEGSNWLVAHQELRTSRRVRWVFDKLAEALGAPQHGNIHYMIDNDQAD